MRSTTNVCHTFQTLIATLEVMYIFPSVPHLCTIFLLVVYRIKSLVNILNFLLVAMATVKRFRACE